MWEHWYCAAPLVVLASRSRFGSAIAGNTDRPDSVVLACPLVPPVAEAGHEVTHGGLAILEFLEKARPGLRRARRPGAAALPSPPGASEPAVVGAQAGDEGLPHGREAM